MINRTNAKTLLVSIGILIGICTTWPSLGCSSSSGEDDEAAIQAGLQKYAQALDWPRGTGWEDRFSPVVPESWRRVSTTLAAPTHAAR